MLDVFLYSVGSGETTKKEQSAPIGIIRSAATHFRSFPPTTSPSKVSEEIRQDNIDVLVDLCGHAGPSIIGEICALRPARKLVSYMGFPGSHQADYIDYQIVDESLVPGSLRKFYKNSLIFMPGTYYVNSHKYLRARGGKRRQRKDYGISDTASFVFCNHGRADKIDPATFFCWIRALKRVEGSVLWLLKSGDAMEKNLRAYAAKAGISQARLVFSDVANSEEHLERLGLCDLFLDTPCYNSHTVAVDAMSRGVPMVTMLREGRENRQEGFDFDAKDYMAYGCITDKLSSRVGASLTRAAGLGDRMIAKNLKEYEELMVKFAMDKKLNVEVKESLSSSDNPLFDTVEWVRAWERAVLAIHRGDYKGGDIYI